MEGHYKPRSRSGPRVGTLASALILIVGAGACDQRAGPGPEGPQPLGQAAQQDREPGEHPDDIDIGARSTESGAAERNEAAADADTQPGSRDSTLGPESAEDTRIAAAGSTGAVSASAVIEPVGGSQARGDASFIETEQGLEIVVMMSGLEPGEHGIHVHENGDCSGPAAEAAGDHFNPLGSPHGAPTNDPSERHAGDLGNISADASGEAELYLVDEILTVEGEHGVAGKAIIVHSGEDDLMSQPSGESGDPVACGVIEVTARG